MRFKGRTLLATGAASGIGASVVERFVAEGGRVAILDRDEDKASEIAGRLERAVAIRCDVSSEASVKEAVARAADMLEGIDCVLNSAGHVFNQPITEMLLEDWNKMLTVHLTGTFLICREAIPHIRRGGSVVNMSSVAALAGARNLAAYSAAKGGVLAFSRQLAVELAPQEIRVNAVLPGSIETPMSIELALNRGNGDLAAGIQPIIDTTPLGRVGKPHEAASAILFLLSDDASYFTGTQLVPDGGRTAI